MTMTPVDSAVTVVPFGLTAVLVTSDQNPAAVARHLRTRIPAALVTSVVPGADSVVVNAAAGVLSPALVEHVQGALVAFDPTASQPGRLVEVEVTYDGEDLADVAAHLGLSVEEVVARHCAPTYTVDFLGFAPGFPYLSGLDPVLAAVPRLDVPRTRVPVGSVGVAAGRTCIYPSVSPGGWRLLGRTDVRLFDVTSTEVGGSPAVLAPGDRVRFVPTAGQGE